MAKNKKKVLVAMSGGVDSSLAAKLLRDRGYQVTGMFLYFWQEPAVDGPKKIPAGRLIEAPGGGRENKCCSSAALMDARRVCRQLGIRLYTMNLNRIFKQEIVDNFLSEYNRGRTPNPCVRCNKLVKLGLLLKRARQLGFEALASGHYARLVNGASGPKLLRAKDQTKDQSYFLYQLSREQLKYLIFPLGGYYKTRVRELARKYKLPVAAKSDSQEICFIPGKSHNDFLKRHLKFKPGPIVLLPSALPPGLPPAHASRERGVKDIKLLQDKNNKAIINKKADDLVIGQHQGLPLYTIGQRQGIEIGGGPYYVAQQDYQKNILYVVNEPNHPALLSNGLLVAQVNWLKDRPPRLPYRCQAQIRYRQQPVDCLVQQMSRGNRRLSVEFDQPQRAVTPGQSLVFYQGQQLIGGGVIERAL